jgi:protein SCO1/2
MQRQIFLPVLLGLTVLLGFGAGWFFIAAQTFHSHVIDPPRLVADIRMKDEDGQLFELGKTQKKVVLLFFGYTHCPDECPLTLANLKLALEMLGAEAAQKVQVVMVSTDPDRDTPEVLNRYLNKFNADFLGITGSIDEMQKIYDDYNVIVLEGGETHSTFVYVIDSARQLRLTFLPDTMPEDIAHDLRILLAH